MRIFRLLTVIILMCIGNILFAQSTTEIFLTTNTNVEYNGLAGAEAKLGNFNHIVAIKDISNERIKLYFTNFTLYPGNWRGKMDFYHFHFSNGINKIARLGVDVSYLTLPKTNRYDWYGDIVGSYTNYIYSIRLAYSGLFKIDSGIGIAVQWTHAKFYGFSANSFTLDIGYTRFGILQFLTFTPEISMQYRQLQPRQTRKYNGLTFSINISNMAGKVKFFEESEGDPTPQRLSIGIDYKIIDSQLIGLHLVYKAEKPLTVYNIEKNSWDPFWKALYTG